MPTPSLLIVPARFKTGKLYSQIPTSGAGDFTVTRATSATRVNASGLIESVASGIPRLDYYTSGGVTGCPALLVEPAATNLVPSGTVYTALAGSLVSSVTDTPAIGVSGALCTKNTASGSTAYIRQLFSAVALSSGTTYSVSRFFKYNGVAFNTTLEAESSTQWGGVGFIQRIVLSAASGVTLGLSTACTGSVENFGNGWYRVNVRVTTGATIGGSANVTILSELPSALSTGQGFLTACPQLETGSVATSYIPTTTGSVTRNADVISVSGAVSGSIGQTEGTMYFEVSDVKGVITGTGNPALMIRNSAFTNWIGLTSNSVAAPFRITVRSTITTLINYTSAISEGKVAIAYSASGAVIYVNGTEVASTPTNPNFTFNIVSMEQYMPFKVKSLALYTTRLSNAELAAITQL